MMCNKIKYLVYYDINNDEARNFQITGAGKANYIIYALGQIQMDTDIISASLISYRGYFKGSKVHISDKIRLVKLPACKRVNMLQKITSHIWSKVALFIYLIAKIKPNEPVIIYHSLSLMRCVRLARFIKKFKIILEVEEIYSDVVDSFFKYKKRELKFISSADKYIFVSELLQKKINKQNKPYIIAHGTYKVEPDRQVTFGDNKIHVVYAGTFDPRKGGTTAVAVAEWLPENYHVHIIGFGSEKETEAIKKKIQEINKNIRANITYDGLLSGEEYIRFLQKCQIGLCPQNPDTDFNNTSFPSKILSYMSNGLRVVTVRIPAIEGSAIGKDVYYYEKQSPKAIAEAIMKIDFNDGYDGRKRIKELDEKFKDDLGELLK